MRRPRVLLVVGLVLVVVAALVVGGVAWWRWAHRSGLERALDVVPASSLRVAYTDWAQVRARLGGDLGARPSSAKIEKLVSKAYDTDFAAVSSVDEAAVALQENYGFSPAVADWEAFAQGREGAVMVMRLPDADFEDLRANLTDLGYRKPKDDDGVWRGGVDLVAAIDPTISPELQHVALLEGQELVVTSDSFEYAETAAEVAGGDADSLATTSSVRELAGALEEPANAMVWADDFACQDLAMSRADDDAQAQAEQLVSEAGGVDPLTGLAMAMYGDRSLHVVEEFEDSDRAERNLRPRAKLAVGEAVGRGGSLDDDLRLTGSSSSGSTVRLTFRPRQETGFVLSLVNQGPVLLATC